MSEMSPRNLQLGIFSLLFSGLGLGYSAQEISEKGLLYGYSNAVVLLLLLQSGDKEHRITAHQLLFLRTSLPISLSQLLCLA